MVKILKSELYINELYEFIKDVKLDINNKSILIAGATGLICSYLVDVLMLFNKEYDLNIKVFAVGRSKKRAYERFEAYFGNSNFDFIEHDISEALNLDFDIDYIINGAGNSHPYVFALDPVGTMVANFNGMYNIMEYSRLHNVKRILYISSGEVYGKSSNEINEFCEDYSGYIDFTNPRACYPSSKRATETLCESYIKQYNIDTVIVRPCHIYGPTMTENDSRVIAQFIRNVISKENIIMKSEGKQIRNYCYVSDAVNAILKVLFEGKKGEAYNISDKNSIISIKELAEICASISKKNVIVSIPSDFEKSGYSTVDRAVLNSNKIENIGWKSKISIKSGLKRTINILENLNNKK